MPLITEMQTDPPSILAVEARSLRIQLRAMRQEVLPSPEIAQIVGHGLCWLCPDGRLLGPGGRLLATVRPMPPRGYDDDGNRTTSWATRLA